MKAIVQRVMQASVTVGDEVVSSIGRGLCVLVGISRHDTPKEIEYLVRKITNLRVFEDDQQKRWSKSVMDKQFEILCVSQFTLMCTLKGNKPDYHESMAADQSQAFYEEFLSQLRKAYLPDKIKGTGVLDAIHVDANDGKFGAYMQVHIQNDGPVTIPLETPATTQKDTKKQRADNSSSSSEVASAGDTT